MVAGNGGPRFITRVVAQLFEFGSGPTIAVGAHGFGPGLRVLGMRGGGFGLTEGETSAFTYGDKGVTAGGPQ